MKHLLYLWQRRRARRRVERLYDCATEAHAEGFMTSVDFYLKLARDAEMEFLREYPDAPAGCVRREARRPWLCLRHDWQRIFTQANGVGFLDQCSRCKCGRYLNFAGHASETGTISAARMLEFQRQTYNGQEVVRLTGKDHDNEPTH